MNDVLDLFGVDPEITSPVEPIARPEPKPTARPAKPIARPEPKPIARPEPAAPVGGPPEPPARVPEDTPRPAQILDCGHTDWSGDAANDAARAEGHCCANHRHQISWAHLRGKYVRPLPLHCRRSPEKERGLGFPGYCCDDNGFYIGGIANDCRYYGPDERRCVVHATPIRAVSDGKEPAEPDPVEAAGSGDVVAPDTTADPPRDPPMPPLPKASGSWKQRQMSAKQQTGGARVRGP